MLKNIWEFLKIVIVSLLIILPIRYFIIQPFYVKGASMEPNFHDREYLIIDEISYRFNEPQRGQVIVFRYPNNPQEYFIKRVIGLPGDTYS
jgi:signal peptidase I